MKVGAGFCPYWYCKDPKYRRMLSQNFDFLTPIWGLTPRHTLYSADIWLSRRLLEAIALVREDGLELYGHYLMSRSIPHPWFRIAKKAGANLSGLISEMCQKLANSIPGGVEDWLIVNEMFSQHGIMKNDFQSLCDCEVIPFAFRAAHKASPKTRLWIGEFGVQNELLWDRLYEYVARLIDTGLPIHGVAAHLHTNLYAKRGRLELSGVARHLYPFHGVKMNNLRKQIRRFKRLGLQFHLSECTVWIAESTQERIEAQGVTYMRYAKAAKEEGVDRISFWSPLDDIARPELSWHWQGKRDYPGLFSVRDGKIEAKSYTKELLENLNELQEV